MKVLFLSNGHGEDLNASLILGALRSLEPFLQIGAMPLVGMGNAYRRLQVEIIALPKIYLLGELFISILGIGSKILRLV